jgi:hypothetical protein
MVQVPSLIRAPQSGKKGKVIAMHRAPPNPSIERTSKRLRLLAAAHVER